MANLLGPVGQLKIVNKEAKLVSFGSVMNYAQREIIDHFETKLRERKKTRIIVLKARQIGISTVTEALMFTLAMARNRMSGLVISHEGDSAKHLLSMTRTYWDEYWAKDLFTAKSLAQNHVSWVETGSSIRIATAGNTGAGRSTTRQFLHASEVAFWPQPTVLMKGLAQSVPSLPNSFIVMESTANGRGNYFYNQWHAATAGASEYTPMFFPWWKHPEYVAETIGWEHTSLKNLSTEETTVRAFLKTKGLTSEEADSRMKWRRYALADLCGGDILTLHQEYPSHPEEAFIATGTNIFDAENLTSCYQPRDGQRGNLMRVGNRVEFSEDPAGAFTQFYPPDKDTERGQYVAFADPARTTGPKSDYAVIQVVHRRTWKQVAVWHGKCDPVTLGDHLIDIALYYNQAIANCEITGPGEATISVLISKNYPRKWENQKLYQHPKFSGHMYGLFATAQTKPAYIGFLQKAVGEHTITVHDRRTYQELVDYSVQESGKYGPADEENGNDDCVTSLAGAMLTVITMASELAPYQGRTQPEDRDGTPGRIDPETANNLMHQQELATVAAADRPNPYPNNYFALPEDE